MVVNGLSSVYVKIVKALSGSCNDRKISGLKLMENTLDLPYFALVKQKIFAFGRQCNFLADFCEVLGWAYQQTLTSSSVFAFLKTVVETQSKYVVL